MNLARKLTNPSQMIFLPLGDGAALIEFERKSKSFSMDLDTKNQPAAKEVIRLTKELIRFKSMHSAPDEIHRCADFILDYLKDQNINHQTFEHNGYPSILMLPRPCFAPVLLMSHIDVVDAPDALFDPVEKNGNLYGRGAIDDKYAAALSLVLLKEHIQLDSLFKLYDRLDTFMEKSAQIGGA